MQAREGTYRLILPAMVIAEAAYVFASLYHAPHARIAEQLAALIKTEGIEPHPNDPAVVLDALQRFHDRRIDFADAYLAALAAKTTWPIASFDRDFKRFKDITLNGW